MEKEGLYAAHYFANSYKAYARVHHQGIAEDARPKRGGVLEYI